MIGLLKEIQSRVRIGRPSPDHVTVDTVVSTLHHRATSTLLLICCALVSCRQYFGDPVLCVQDAPNEEAAIPSHVLNTYCFVTSTYTVVGPAGETWQGQGEDQRRHAYYQWVPFVLFLQSILFAVPHAAWKNWEGGLVQGSLAGLTDKVRGPKRDQLRLIAHYFVNRLHTFRVWAAGYYTCQLLNLVNVLANVYLTDLLLGGRFSLYGLELSVYSIETLLMSPADMMFPKLTKCTFRKYGPSGTIQLHDALCVMALNVVNEKLFSVLWFWFALLTLVTVLSVLWHLVVLGLLACASAHSRSFMAGWAQRALGTPVTLDSTYISPVTQNLDFGDWLFLQLLGTNMGGRVYREFMEQLVQAAERLKPSEVQPLWNS